MKRIFVAETVQKAGERVRVSGWVHAIRDHSKVIFIDLRDRSGLLQVVCFSSQMIEELRKQGISREDVLTITGTVAKRPEKLTNDHIVTGTIELQAEKIELISKSETPPFEIEDEIMVDEELRMQYRYLDLRRPEMLKRFEMRHQLIHFIRSWLTKDGFVEVETPMLTKDTPEGSREYLVPSRLHPGKGYALPQSPQQFKQLLMVAGFERYFQIARCMRDEDPRGDRQQEFTQLDLEMSFIEQEDVLDLTEKLFNALVKDITPHKKLSSSPFKRMTWDEAMQEYKSDKPDLRKEKNNPDELAFAFITDFPLFEATKEGGITSSHHPFTSWKNTEENNEIMEKVRKGESVDKEKLLSIRANAYDLVLNGHEVGGGSIRIHNAAHQEAMFKALGLSDTQIQDRFGHMLKAFTYGVPPHGGIAPGIDRLVMILANQPNIREVIAFPKTGDGRDLMMGAPSDLTDDKLKELHLKKRDET